MNGTNGGNGGNGLCELHSRQIESLETHYGTAMAVVTHNDEAIRNIHSRLDEIIGLFRDRMQSLSERVQTIERRRIPSTEDTANMTMGDIIERAHLAEERAARAESFRLERWKLIAGVVGTVITSSAVAALVQALAHR